MKEFTYRNCYVTLTKDKSLDGTSGVVVCIEAPNEEVIDDRFLCGLNMTQGTVDAKITIDDYYEALHGVREGDYGS